jgi:hypothetical protein
VKRGSECPRGQLESHLQDWRAIEAEVKQISHEGTRVPTIELIRTLSEALLRAFANEAQLLYELIRKPLTLEDYVMPRPFFIGYLRSYVVSPTGRQLARKLRRAMGWKKPPYTPIARVFEQLASDQAAKPTPPPRSA